MVSPSVFLTACFAVTGLASALPPTAHVGTTVTDKKGFSIKQVERPNFTPNGPFSVYRTYLKYGVTPPQWLHEAVAKYGGDLGKRATGSAVTTPVEFDSFYLTPVQIGTPAQTLNLDVDTGSSDLWVFNDRTPAASVQGQTIYRTSQSSTARNVSGATWSIRYGDGSSSSGTVVTDVVSVGGYAVQNQSVELATTVSSQFVEDGDIDGLLGLGFDTLNTVRPNRASTFFSTGKAGLDAPVFTADLKAGAPGTYDFGFIDDSKYNGEITYTNVNNTPGYWTLTASGYKFGSNAFTSTPITGIADTGTTLLYLPNSIISRYYASISGSGFTQLFGGYYVPCAATLPDFTFGIGSTQFTIPGKYVNYAPLLGTLCFAGIQSSDDIGLNIFGDVLLKAVFVVFEAEDGATPRIGFASKDLA